MVELLSPAGSLSKLKTVIRYGADAVYMGGKAFNLRAQSHNFSKEALKEAVDYCHAHGKRAYVTLNIIAHNKEIKAMPAFIKFLDEIKVDAVIVADLGVLEIVQENSSIPIHISTQSSSTNWRTIKVWQKLGAKRVVLAREVSIDDMKRIKDNVPEMELEVFAHGAMCMTYSGRCQLSSYMAERDGNRGVCANTCRWKFALVEERRPGEYFPVYEDDQGSHIYNSKDLCTVEFIDKLIDAGVNGLKIEGRMKSMLYGATTTKAYREAIDSYYSPGGFQYDPKWREELETYSHRGYTTGFYFGKLDKNATNLEGGYKQKFEMVGHIVGLTESGDAQVELLNKVLSRTAIGIVKPHGPVLDSQIESMILLKTGLEVDVAQPNQVVSMKLSTPFEVGDILRQDATQVASYADAAAEPAPLPSEDLSFEPDEFELNHN